MCGDSRALDDMVFEDIDDGILISALERVIQFCVWDLVEGIIVRREDLEGLD